MWIFLDIGVALPAGDVITPMDGGSMDDSIYRKVENFARLQRRLHSWGVMAGQAILRGRAWFAFFSLRAIHREDESYGRNYYAQKGS